MESRKIQLVGERSYSVTLPKNWVKSSNLREKDTVFMDVSQNGDLVVRPINTGIPERGSLSVEADNLENISEFLVFCYVKNINSISLTSKGFDYKTIKSIRGTLKYLEGYDIVSETSKRIDISFLFQDVNITISRLYSRVVYLLEIMVTSLKKKDYSSLEEVETSVDRLYHLAKRVLVSCIRNQKARKENEIKHDEDLFFMNIVFKKLENIADSLFQMRERKLSGEDEEAIRALIRFLNTLSKKKTSLTSMKNQLKSSRIRSSNRELRPLLKNIFDLCQDVFENMMSVQLNRKFFPTQ